MVCIAKLFFGNPEIKIRRTMEDIICLQCSNVIKSKDDWDFMDGEKHKITCSCGHRFIVIIERPIEYYIPEPA